MGGLVPLLLLLIGLTASRSTSSWTSSFINPLIINGRRPSKAGCQDTYSRRIGQQMSFSFGKIIRSVEASSSSSSSPPTYAYAAQSSMSMNLWKLCEPETTSMLTHPLIVQLGTDSLPQPALLAYFHVLEGIAHQFTQIFATDLVLQRHLANVQSSLHAEGLSEELVRARDDLLIGVHSANRAVLQYIAREGGKVTAATRDHPWIALVLASAFLRLKSTIGHTLATTPIPSSSSPLSSSSPSSSINHRQQLIEALRSPDLNTCLMEVEALLRVDDANTRPPLERLSDFENTYRSFLALLFNLVDVIGSEAGLRGSQADLIDGRKALKKAMGVAANKQAAAIAAAAAYKKAKAMKDKEQMDDEGGGRTE